MVRGEFTRDSHAALGRSNEAADQQPGHMPVTNAPSFPTAGPSMEAPILPPRSEVGLAPAEAREDIAGEGVSQALMIRQEGLENTVRGLVEAVRVLTQLQTQRIQTPAEAGWPREPTSQRRVHEFPGQGRAVSPVLARSMGHTVQLFSQSTSQRIRSGQGEDRIIEERPELPRAPVPHQRDSERAVNLGHRELSEVASRRLLAHQSSDQSNESSGTRRGRSPVRRLHHSRLRRSLRHRSEAHYDRGQIERLLRRVEQLEDRSGTQERSVGYDRRSPFTREIEEQPLPHRFKVPAIKMYRGDSDPYDHLDSFNVQMDLQTTDSLVKCRVFPATLGEIPRKWLRGLPAHSISSWEECQEKFLKQYQALRTQLVPACHLATVFQGRDESLRKYVDRFRKEISRVDNPSDDSILTAISAGLRKDGKLYESIYKKPVKDLSEFYERATMEIRWEEAFDIKKSTQRGGASSSAQNKRRDSGESSKGSRHSDRYSQAAKRARTERPPWQSQQIPHTTLTMSPARIFAIERNRENFGKPIPMKNPPPYREGNKYCSYHREAGHTTAECRALREAIEDLIRRGRLREYVVRPTGQASQQQQSSQSHPRPAQQAAPSAPDQEHQPAVRIIHTIHGGPHPAGTSNRARDRYVREADRSLSAEYGIEHPIKMARPTSDDITFTENDAKGICWPHNDAIVIRATVGNCEVRRIMIDSGSSVNVLFRGCYEQMELGSDQLKPSPGPLYGFTGDSTIPMGLVNLPLSIGSGERRSTILADFLVIDCPSAYNVILGRPAMNDLDMVTSTKTLTIKFPTLKGIGCVRGDQYIARECYENAVKTGIKGKKVHLVAGGEPMKMTTTGISDDIDPRETDANKASGPVEELEDVQVSDIDPQRCLKLGKNLAPEIKPLLVNFLKDNLDVFAWNHEDMIGIHPEVISHRLNLDARHRPVRQKRRSMNNERYIALKEEVDKLLINGFIRESHYPAWVANPVLVKKKNGKWRTCVDFTNLNQACPKDSFPLPRIDQLVDSTASHELLSFMDAYSGYNQIPMYPPDEEHTSFITDRGLYCYKVMPFGLKNAGATYQRLVNQMFEKQIGKTMEVYVDDMLVKSKKAEEHVCDLKGMFQILRQYQMKLNPLKCAFGVASGKFLGFIVNQRGIEANPDKIKALVDMRSPTKPRDVQCLNGQIAALSRFISKATDKCIPFFDALKKANRFQWTEECEVAFQQLKDYVGRAPLLSKPKEGEKLIIYLGVSQHALSAVLIREEAKVQHPVYYVSKRLLNAETRYSAMEKLAYCLIIASRKLRPYFQAHSIEVLTQFPLRQVLLKPDMSGRLLKWAIELAQYDIEYKPRTAVKGQALADFLVEFSGPQEEEMRTLQGPVWDLYVDGSSNDQGAGAGVILISPEGHRFSCALRFGFRATNNEAEYEALIAGLRLARETRAERLQIYSDSQLVVCQIQGEYQTRESKMMLYLQIVQELIIKFESVEIKQIPRTQNTHADALARLASTNNADFLETIPVDFLPVPSTDQSCASMVITIAPNSWMSPIIQYLQNESLPEDKVEARSLRMRATRYCIYDDMLFKKGFSAPLLRCIDGEDCEAVMREIHEGHCGNHAGGLSLAQKALRQGFYWPTMKQDALELVKKCDRCQRFAKVPRAPPAYLQSMVSPWPFAIWGIDLIGPLPKARGNCKHAVVAVDYFTKWVEAKELAEISSSKIINFVWVNIICRFGVPQQIVTDNGTQFTSEQFTRFCNDLKITKSFSAVDHPQANGQVEAVNKIIKQNLKTKLEAKKGGWIDELPYVLWAYRTTPRSTTGESPFSMAYGSDAMVPAEIEVPSQRRATFNSEENDQLLSTNLDLLEEQREMASLRIAMYQRRIARYFNKKVKIRSFKQGDLVLRLILPGARKTADGVLGPNWEGPYIITKNIGNGAYHLADMSGAEFSRAWNAEHLRPYFQ